MCDLRSFFNGGRLTLSNGTGYLRFVRQHTEPRLPQLERFSTSAEVHYIDFIETPDSDIFTPRVSEVQNVLECGLQAP